MDAVLELEIGPGSRARARSSCASSVGRRRATEVIRLDVDDLAARVRCSRRASASAVPARRSSPTEAALRDVGERLFESTFTATSERPTARAARSLPERGTGLQSPCGSRRPNSRPCRGSRCSIRTPRSTCAARSRSCGTSRRRTPARTRSHAAAAHPRDGRGTARVAPARRRGGERERLRECAPPAPRSGPDRTRVARGCLVGRLHPRQAPRAEWHVLHFIGHGTYDTATDEGMLAFVGADGVPISCPRTPSPTCSTRRSRRRGSSCSTRASRGRPEGPTCLGTAAALAHSGIHAVAAMQFSISDAAAIAFARGFYTALAHGRDVDEAVRSGRIGILGTGRDLEWVTPVLSSAATLGCSRSGSCASTGAGGRGGPAACRAGAPDEPAAAGARALRSPPATATGRRAAYATPLASVGRPRRTRRGRRRRAARLASHGRAGAGGSTPVTQVAGWERRRQGIAGARQKEGPVEADSVGTTDDWPVVRSGRSAQHHRDGQDQPRGRAAARSGPRESRTAHRPNAHPRERQHGCPHRKARGHGGAGVRDRRGDELRVPGGRHALPGVNDTSTGDNEGAFHVVVTYIPPQ